MTMKKLSPMVVLPLVLVLLASPACVKKSIGVRSDPPGATVYLDGLEVGQTPVDFIPFDFYGTRQITLHKPGCLSEKRLVRMKAPWYEWFPIDIVSELVVPWTVRDQRTYYFSLARTPPAEDAALLRNAHETREVAQARIEGARREFHYRPPAYVAKGAERKSVFWGPFTAPPRTEPIYRIEKPEEEPGEEPQTQK